MAKTIGSTAGNTRGGLGGAGSKAGSGGTGKIERDVFIHFSNSQKR